MKSPVSLREKFARGLPAALQTCPFECFLALLTILAGIAVVAGSIEPNSLLEALPRDWLKVWGVAMVLGGVTLTAGLIRKTFPRVLAAGLGLIAPLLAAYAVSVIAFNGWEKAGLSGIFFALIAALTGFRAIYLGAEADASERIHTDEGNDS